MINVKIDRNKIEPYIAKALDLFKVNFNSKEIKKLNDSLVSDFNCHVRIEKIIKMDFLEIKKLKHDCFQDYKKFYRDDKNLKQIWKKFFGLYDDLRDSKDKKAIKFNTRFVRELGLTVCPYCNTSFIHNRDESATAQLDHFYPKSKYPVFAISVYNLVPSCYGCNHIKSDTEIGYSPYDDSINFNDLVEFNYTLDGDIERRKILIERRQKDDKNLEKNIKELKLELAYDIHTDLIKDILTRAKSLNDKRKKDLKGIVNITDDDVKCYIIGSNSNEDWHKKPLAKMISDIYNKNVKNLT